ncbi:hypothetical protein [Spirillospora sp. NPDC047279]|uniref:hypothetical protein n=1 Tax=Spirillospora sp. NPDC047279 TaxID=3155478 RepID=UPI0033E2DB3E
MPARGHGPGLVGPVFGVVTQAWGEINRGSGRSAGRTYKTDQGTPASADIKSGSAFKGWDTLNGARVAKRSEAQPGLKACSGLPEKSWKTNTGALNRVQGDFAFRVRSNEGRHGVLNIAEVPKPSQFILWKTGEGVSS